jgi:phenylacetate-CoA ligase
LHALQNKKLRRAIKQAYTYVPYYHNLFREKGWTPEDFRTAEDLRRLPILTRQELAANYPIGLMAKGSKPSLVRVTSGTTGESVRVAFSDEYMETKTALMLRRFAKYGIRPWHRIVTIWDPPWRWRRTEDEDGTLHRTTQLLELPFAMFMGRPLPQIKVIQGGVGDVKSEAEDLVRLNPDFVFGRPTHLRRIAKSLAASGLAVKPLALICTNEVLTDMCAKELQNSFNAKTLRLFGGSEAGPMGEDCKFGTGIHLNQDHYVIEVLKDGEPVGPGEKGEVVLTHLHNPTMPLMRYPMGDFVELGEDGTCECGSNLPRLKSIQGRMSDRLIAHDGSRLAPLPVANHIESEFGLRDFQLVQTGRNDFELRLTRGSRIDPLALKKISGYLAKLTGSEVEVKLETRGDEEQWLKERPVMCTVR